MIIGCPYYIIEGKRLTYWFNYTPSTQGIFSEGVAKLQQKPSK
ncbi:hypothetical protein ALTERO38_20185 [Alteromonas sp. 38]|nr:hypothetical protein ALTER154_100354 [Alteromonas sp. 154]VXB00708.1 hypothetical protein ALTERO38_20185 [Alteromonas sp. 38]